MGMMEAVEKYADIAEHMEYLRNEPQELEKQKRRALETIARNMQEYKMLSSKAGHYAAKLRAVHSQERQRARVHIYSPGQYFSKEEQAEMRDVMSSLGAYEQFKFRVPFWRQIVVRDRTGHLKSASITSGIAPFPPAYAGLGAWFAAVCNQDPVPYAAAALILGTAITTALAYVVSSRNEILSLAKALQSKAQSIDTALNEVAKGIRE